MCFVDSEPRVGRHLIETLERLGANNADVRVSDAIKFLRHPAERFDIVFLDPPFASDLLPRACDALAAGWLLPNALVYLEAPADTPLPELPRGWSVHRSGRAGQVSYHLVRAPSAA